MVFFDTYQKNFPLSLQSVGFARMKFGKYFVLFALAVSVVRADNQTPTVSPIELSGLPYSIQLQNADMGSASLPTLQAYAAGTYDGMWVLMAGRTNGLHKFTNDGLVN